MKIYRNLTLEKLVRLWEEQEHLRLVNRPTILFHAAPGLDLIQLDFRFFDDDAALGSATALAATNTNPSTIDTDTNFRIRFTLDEGSNGNAIGGGIGNDFSFRLEYRHVEGTNTWTDVSASSSVIQASDSTNVTDGVTLGSTNSPIGDSIYTGANGDTDYHAGEYDDGDGHMIISGEMSDTEWTEVEFCVQIVGDDVSDTDTIDLRVTWGGTYGGTDVSDDKSDQPLESYTNTPQITVNKEAGGGVVRRLLALLGVGR